ATSVPVAHVGHCHARAHNRAANVRSSFTKLNPRSWYPILTRSATGRNVGSGNGLSASLYHRFVRGSVHLFVLSSTLALERTDVMTELSHGHPLSHHARLQLYKAFHESINPRRLLRMIR